MNKAKRKKRRAPHHIDFERLFRKGHGSYDTSIGDWWEWRSGDASHRAAYRFTCDVMRKAFAQRKQKPRLLLDYACGGGHFLKEAAQAFPESQFVALDGSHKMLRKAAERLQDKGIDCDIVSLRAAFRKEGPRIRLVQTFLPNFSLPKGLCDGVAFVFPNITPGTDEQDYYDRHGYKNRRDQEIARMLARFREMDPEDEVSPGDPESFFEGFMTERVISRHIRSLLRPKGLWFKVDYANAFRKELSPLTLWRTLFTEGALREPIKEKVSQTYFRYLRDDFRRSKVILDVYHQTKDPSDKTGGYFVSSFEAESFGD